MSVATGKERQVEKTPAQPTERLVKPKQNSKERVKAQGWTSNGEPKTFQQQNRGFQALVRDIRARDRHTTALPRTAHKNLEC